VAGVGVVEIVRHVPREGHPRHAPRRTLAEGGDVGEGDRTQRGVEVQESSPFPELLQDHPGERRKGVWNHRAERLVRRAEPLSERDVVEREPGPCLLVADVALPFQAGPVAKGLQHSQAIPTAGRLDHAHVRAVPREQLANDAERHRRLLCRPGRLGGQRQRFGDGLPGVHSPGLARPITRCRRKATSLRHVRFLAAISPWVSGRERVRRRCLRHSHATACI
jgi:hypothetical protein